MLYRITCFDYDYEEWPLFRISRLPLMFVLFFIMSACWFDLYWEFCTLNKINKVMLLQWKLNAVKWRYMQLWQNYDRLVVCPFFLSTSQSLHLNIFFSPSHNDSIICSADTISRLLHVALRMAGVQPYLRVGTSAMSHVDITNCHNFKSLEFADFPHQHTLTITYLSMHVSSLCTRSSDQPCKSWTLLNGKQRISESLPSDKYQI